MTWSESWVNCLTYLTFTISHFCFIALIFSSHDVKIDTWLNIFRTLHRLNGIDHSIETLSENHVISVQRLSLTLLTRYLSLTSFSICKRRHITLHIWWECMHPIFSTFRSNKWNNIMFIFNPILFKCRSDDIHILSHPLFKPHSLFFNLLSQHIIVNFCLCNLNLIILQFLIQLLTKLPKKLKLNCYLLTRQYFCTVFLLLRYLLQIIYLLILHLLCYSLHWKVVVLKNQTLLPFRIV